MAQGIGRARLAIPKVNRNPGVAKARNLTGQAGLGQSRALAPSPATAPPAPSAPATPATQSTPTDPFKAAAAAPPGPRAPGNDPFEVPNFTPANGQPDPRDATYWTNVAKLQFNDRQEYAKDLADQTTADSNYSYATQQAIQNRAVSQRTLGENAIRGNLSASGWLDREEAEGTKKYTGERAQAELSKNQEDAARLAARTALSQGFSLDVAGELAAAASRYAAAQAEASENESPELAAEAAVAAAPAVAASAAAKPKIGISNAKALNPVKAAIANRKKAR